MSLDSNSGPSALKTLKQLLLAFNPLLGRQGGPTTGCSNFQTILMKHPRKTPDSAPVTLDFPAPSDVPYQLRDSAGPFYSQNFQDEMLWPAVLESITEYYALLSEKTQGSGGQQPCPFFVESGARDGEEHSNTLFLERFAGWSGLLIEPSDIEYPFLLEKKRKCYSWHGCLSPTGKSEDVYFDDTGDGLGCITDKAGQTTVKAESLLSLLQATDRHGAAHTVDFWSLDIEGSEGPVLENTDFDAIEFGVLLIEMNKGRENNDRIRRVMEANNFLDVGCTMAYQPDTEDDVLDRIFINPKYFETRDIPIPENIEIP